MKRLQLYSVIEIPEYSEEELALRLKEYLRVLKVLSKEIDGSTTFYSGLLNEGDEDGFLQQVQKHAAQI